MLFPNGWELYLFGGILIGCSIAFLYVFTGFISGASAVLDGFTSFLTRYSDKGFRDVRLVYFFSTVAGGLFVALFMGQFVTEVSWWRLLVGGYFVGLGATLAKGCTSGHGVCGLASCAKSSFVYVGIFLVIAIVTALLVGVFL